MGKKGRVERIEVHPIGSDHHIISVDGDTVQKKYEKRKSKM